MRLSTLALAVALCSVALASKQKKSYDGDFLFEEDDWKQKKEKPEVKTWIWDPENGLCSALECRSSEMCLLEDSFTAVCVSRPELKTNGDRIISRQLAEDEHLIKSEPWTSDDIDDDDDEDDEEDEIDLDEDDDDDEYDYDEDEDDEDEDEDEDDDEDIDMQKALKKEKECRECPFTHPTVSTYICGTDNRTYSSLCRLEQHNCVHDTLVTTDCKGFCPCRESGSYRRRKEKLRDTVSKSDSRWHQKKLDKARLKKKYNNYHQEQKSYNNIKYYPKNSAKNLKYQADCSEAELDSMGSRLVDWFVVIKSTNGGVQPRAKHHKYYGAHFPGSCKKMAQWMFVYLDSDSDSQLSQRELYAVERDQQEKCLKPFLDRCDLNGDIFLTTREWCQCFEAVSTPCKERSGDGTGKLGAYVPACDSDGFFRPTQCQGSQCWCADRYGVEQKGTRGRRGTIHCDGDTARYDADFNVADEDDEDNYVIDGSGDGLQEF